MRQGPHPLVNKLSSCNLIGLCPIPMPTASGKVIIKYFATWFSVSPNLVSGQRMTFALIGISVAILPTLCKCQGVLSRLVELEELVAEKATTLLHVLRRTLQATFIGTTWFRLNLKLVCPSVRCWLGALLAVPLVDQKRWLPRWYNMPDSPLRWASLFTIFFFLLKQAEKHALFWVFFRFRGCGTKTMSSRFTVCFSPKVVCEALYGFIDCAVPSSFHHYFKRGKLFFRTKGVGRKPTNDVLLCVLWMPANSSKRAIKVIWSPQANRIMQFPIVR